MIKKKAARASKAGAKKKAKKKSASRKQKDATQVREEISGIVKSSAKGITKAVMGQAMRGNLAPAKYLFEMAGVFPAVNDGKEATQEEDCLAKTLLDRIDRPAQKPVEKDDDEDSDPTKTELGGVTSPVKKDDDDVEFVTEDKPDEAKPDGALNGGDVIV
jgi:hypothetical protein